jgi:hypothetical protein
VHAPQGHASTTKKAKHKLAISLNLRSWSAALSMYCF